MVLPPKKPTPQLPLLQLRFVLVLLHITFPHGRWERGNGVFKFLTNRDFADFQISSGIVEDRKVTGYKKGIVELWNMEIWTYGIVEW